MVNLLVHSIYKATEGEGVHLGAPQIFIRLQGCAVGCVNCDSMETWEFDPATALPLSEILRKVSDLSFGTVPLKRASITGGDPLHPKHEKGVLALTEALKERGYFVNLEASGTRVVPSIFKLCDYISFDYKTPSTGVRTPWEHILTMQTDYPGKFQIKSVISDLKDLEHVFETYQKVWATLSTQGNSTDFPWCLTPVFNTAMDFDLENFQKILKRNEEWGGPFRVIAQQHKWAYGTENMLV